MLLFTVTMYARSQLFRFFDGDGVGQITYAEFCKAINSPFTPGLAAILEVRQHITERKTLREKAPPACACCDMRAHAQVDVLSEMDSGTFEKYVQNVHLVELSGRQESQLEKALRSLGEFVDQLRDEQAWAAPFLAGDPVDPATNEPSGKVAYTFFAQVLREKAHLTDRDLDVVKMKLYPHDLKAVHYRNFYRIFVAYMAQRKTGQALTTQQGLNKPSSRIVL